MAVALVASEALVIWAIARIRRRRSRRSGPVEDVGIDEARHQFEVNVFGPARLTQVLLPAMRARKAGTIVDIGSIGGKIYSLLGSWYHATKHALEGWSDCLRLELAPFGIRVVLVEPGLIETGFGGALLAGITKRAGSGAYADLVRGTVAATEGSYGKGRGTAPAVVADVVAKAVAARKPKIRYAAGKYAEPMIFVRKWFGDRTFDRLIMSRMRRTLARDRGPRRCDTTPPTAARFHPPSPLFSNSGVAAPAGL